ncbi:nitroreductase [Humitalea sp. 24SJ18S-53]|uniref:nitroreductase n=1 Tax=Humitalea sp. 24SJ18S-53 TaxID=3422307 RepID=UPI003D66E37D
MNPAVQQAIAGRRSIRGYTGEAVPDAVIRDILAAASRAPSATNTQPWHVHVVAGAARDRLCAAITAACDAGPEPEAEYTYYPADWTSPYIDRRRQVGWALYSLLGIQKGDRAGAKAWRRENYNLFGAPVGLFFTLDRGLALGSWLDLGMFMQNVMIAARGCGLETCPEAAFKSYHAIIREHLGIPPEQLVVCGMALGHPDHAAPANQLQAPREPVEGFARFHHA